LDWLGNFAGQPSRASLRLLDSENSAGVRFLHQILLPARRGYSLKCAFLSAPFPVSYSEHENLKVGGLPHLVAWFARSLERRHYDRHFVPRCGRVATLGLRAADEATGVHQAGWRRGGLAVRGSRGAQRPSPACIHSSRLAVQPLRRFPRRSIPTRVASRWPDRKSRRCA
jgi:hypothetical protein